jgi:TetR/AcrR family transcriptional regulator
LDVRAKILSEATRLFARKGVDGTSLQEISDAVGVKKPSLLYHFPSKDALHAGVLESVISHLSEALPKLLKAAAREDRFDAILDETIHFFAADPDRARLLLREALDRPTDMRKLLEAGALSWMGLLADSIRKAQAEGLMRADADPEVWLLQVIHLVVGTFTSGPILQTLVGKHSKTVDQRLIHELKRVARASIMVSRAERGE